MFAVAITPLVPLRNLIFSSWHSRPFGVCGVSSAFAARRVLRQAKRAALLSAQKSSVRTKPFPPLVSMITGL